MNQPRHRSFALFAHPFRPFFLAVGIYGALLVGAWIAFLLGGLALPTGLNPLQWHAHEMLFGLVPAAIAGFVMTAMSNWTGAAPLAGRGLLAMVLLWTAGRTVFWTAGALPGWLMMLVDASFLPVLAGYVGYILVRYNNQRNLVLVGIISVLALANVAMHMGHVLGWPMLARLPEIVALDLIAAIMVVIGGRITPAFTANWLRQRGVDPLQVKQSPRLDLAALVATLALIPADLMTAMPALAGAVALLAAALNGYRLSRWAGLQTLREPLLWVLHLGYAWIVLALLLKGLTPFVDSLTPSAWIHAMGTGAIGTLILGVMTRVALGHTGRPLRLPRWASLIYLAITVAALFRVLTALGWLHTRTGLLIAALGWTLGFVLFTLLYAPILIGPRADGRPG